METKILSGSEYEHLIDEARAASDHAYAPYSHFKVGASVLTYDNKIYTGCNIENSSYSPTICAERVAMFKAISEGSTIFKIISIFGKKENSKETKHCFPCGVCRQVMAEFASDDMRIITTDGKDVNIYTLDDLLPNIFQLEH